MALEYFCDLTTCERATKGFEDREECLDHIRAHQRDALGPEEAAEEAQEFDDLEVEVED